MLSILFQQNYKKINFEDMQTAVKCQNEYIIINTMQINEQDCLIKNTTKYDNEERTINELLNKYNYIHKIIVYGKNSNDETVEKKVKQMTNLGFQCVYMYLGGLFEWLLLQDIYGKDEFPTTTNILDILKYRAERNVQMCK